MAKTKSSTKTAALRGSDGTVCPEVIPVDDPFPNGIPRRTERERSLFKRLDKADQESGVLHNMLTCLIALDDNEGGSVTGSEKECAIAWLQWEAFKKSRDLRKAFE
jgi:hypothetical protein